MRSPAPRLSKTTCSMAPIGWRATSGMKRWPATSWTRSASSCKARFAPIGERIPTPNTSSSCPRDQGRKCPETRKRASGSARGRPAPGPSSSISGWRGTLHPVHPRLHPCNCGTPQPFMGSAPRWHSLPQRIRQEMQAPPRPGLTPAGPIVGEGSVGCTISASIASTMPVNPSSFGRRTGFLRR